jgi:hypothetical protein
MPDHTNLAQLQNSIHTALKQWHETGNDTGPLAGLQLYHRAQREAPGSSARQLTNEILLAALDRLAVEQPVEAELLRSRFLNRLVMHVAANQLNLGESTAYRMQQDALQQLALIVQDQETRAQSEYQVHLEQRLKLPPQTPLFGVDSSLTTLSNLLPASDSAWVISIEGLGGIGKTALANALLRRPRLSSHFANLAWVSAKPRDFMPETELEQSAAPALSVDSLVEMLLNQLSPVPILALSPAEKRSRLLELLKAQPQLVVVDNLETVLDYQILLPLLRELANPTKFLLTSRHSLRAHSDVHCHSLAELPPASALGLIRHEAATRGLTLLAQATETDLNGIFEVVGGNPLALKLVVGQISMLPLSQVLDNLKQARGKTITDLYTFIYWQAWRMLPPAAQHLFLLMPLAHDGTLTQLMALTGQDIETVNEAIQQLVRLSLVQVEGALDERRYTIHRLTETFLLHEAIQWKASV